MVGRKKSLIIRKRKAVFSSVVQERVFCVRRLCRLRLTLVIIRYGLFCRWLCEFGKK